MTHPGARVPSLPDVGDQAWDDVSSVGGESQQRRGESDVRCQTRVSWGRADGSCPGLAPPTPDARPKYKPRAAGCWAASCGRNGLLESDTGR